MIRRVGCSDLGRQQGSWWKIGGERAPGRRQVNYVGTRKREHSRKPDEQYPIIEGCSPGPYLELFSRGIRPGWAVWGLQAVTRYGPTWKTYAHNSAAEQGMLATAAE
jgi:hypothetical protein